MTADVADSFMPHQAKEPRKESKLRSQSEAKRAG